MGELGAGPVQGLLGDHALCHVLKGADEHRSTLDLLDDMGDAAHMLHGASGGHDAEGEIDVDARHAARDHGFERRQVIGVDDVANPLHRDFRRRIELEDAEGLLGPVVIVRHQIRDEAARLAQPLGVGEAVVGPPELRLGALSIVDVGEEHIPAGDVLARIAMGQPANLAPAVHAVEAPDARLEIVRRA